MDKIAGRAYIYFFGTGSWNKREMDMLSLQSGFLNQDKKMEVQDTSLKFRSEDGLSHQTIQFPKGILSMC